MSGTSDDIMNALEALGAMVRRFGSVLTAYSGGVDSALVAAVASAQLPPGRALACIGVSPSYPKREMDAAIEFAQACRVPYRLIDVYEHLDANYTANRPDRCYFCKSALFDRLRALASAEGFAVIADGTHADDRVDHRLGIAAGAQRGVRSPLMELGITKSQVRELAKHLALPVWDKPAMACLSSRVPHGTAITAALLRQIERAEDVLFGLGFRQFRVRHQGESARIEVPTDDLPRAMELAEAIERGVRAAGYSEVMIDMGGLRPAVSRPVALRVAMPRDAR